MEFPPVHKVMSLAEADWRDVAAAAFIAECAERPAAPGSFRSSGTEQSERGAPVPRQQFVGFDNLENSNFRLQAWLEMTPEDRAAMARPSFAELLATRGGRGGVGGN